VVMTTDGRIVCHESAEHLGFAYSAVIGVYLGSFCSPSVPVFSPLGSFPSTVTQMRRDIAGHDDLNLTFTRRLLLPQQATILVQVMLVCAGIMASTRRVTPIAVVNSWHRYFRCP
jgi:hypothetical protein